jgi:hypothetical protein
VPDYKTLRKMFPQEAQRIEGQYLSINPNFLNDFIMKLELLQHWKKVARLVGQLLYADSEILDEETEKHLLSIRCVSEEKP